MRVKHVPDPPTAGDSHASDAQTGDSYTGDGQTNDAQTGDSYTDDGQTNDGQTDDDYTGDAVTPETAVARIADAQSAVPLVPGREDDCCVRLQRRVGFQSRDVARTWLTFLRGLGLAVQTDEGFRRTRQEPTVEFVRRALLEGLLGARELADALLDEPVAVETAFEAVSDAVPRWERSRRDDWDTEWRERTVRLLGWFTALGLAEPTTDASADTRAGEATDDPPRGSSHESTRRWRATEPLSNLWGGA